jgi:glucose/arabinose dehydrogenase
MYLQIQEKRNAREAASGAVPQEEAPTEQVPVVPVPKPALNPDQEPAITPASINETGFPLIIPDGFKISLFNKESLGPIRFMAFSLDGILFVSMPSPTGLYSGVKSGGKIYALPDKNKDGKADEVKTVLAGLSDLPHGIAFYNNYLYIAEEDKIARYKYLNNGEVGEREVVIGDIADSGDHVSRTIGFSPSGKMYVSVGSSCNVCEEQDERRATILEYNPDGSGFRIFAKGIRNAVGFVFNPNTGEIWATENGRDDIGDNLPPDEINIIREGLDYGWPYCYGKKVPDPAYNNPGRCAATEASVYDMQAHSASFGLRFWQGDLLVAYHGSWNRSEPTGYKVVRLDVEGNKIIGEQDFVSGWLRPDGSKLGRPVDVIVDDIGAIYISDDKMGLIYRITEIE